MKTAKRRIGDTGEEVACVYLEKKGYRILERNYWKPWGEIDIIAESQNKLVFIEVKTVSRESLEGDFSRGTVRPEENLHSAKLKRLNRAIQTYLSNKHVPETKEWQIDLACVFLDLTKKRAKVELLENIVL